MKYWLRKNLRRMAQNVAARAGSEGIDVFSDIKSRKAIFNPRTMVDVGANSGEMSIMFSRMFPNAKVFSLEPSRKNISVLKKNTSNYGNISVHQVAIGSDSGVIGFMDDDSNHTMSRVTEGGYEVKISTLDDFCKEHNVSHIDYLKIDTEGHDLAVLSGATELMADKAIDFIEVECGMNPDNKYHIPFEEVKKLLENQNYRLFGVYEQTKEWIIDRPNLRRVNSVFMPNPL